MEIEWWKLLGAETRQSPQIVSEVVEAPPPKQSDVGAQTDIPFQEIGSIVGGAIGFTTYVWTYPITWIDGPLPIVDVLWLGGLAYSTGRGARMGSQAGKKLDIIEEVLF